MKEWMNEWMNQGTKEWAWLFAWMHECMKAAKHEGLKWNEMKMKIHMNMKLKMKWMNGWMIDCMNAWTHECMNEKMNQRINEICQRNLPKVLRNLQLFSGFYVNNYLMIMWLTYEIELLLQFRAHFADPIFQSAPERNSFLQFLCEIKLSLQSCAHFANPSFQKTPERLSCLTFSPYRSVKAIWSKIANFDFGGNFPTIRLIWKVNF